MDRALRGNKLTKQRRMGQEQRIGPDRTRQSRAEDIPKEEEIDSLEALGIYASGGIEGKPHSTKEGRLSAGRNWYNRAWGQKYNKKKGVKV